MEALVLFGALMALILIGVPVGFAMGLSSLIVIIGFDTMSPVSLAKSIVDSAQNYPLLAVPLFILAGDLMFSGGLSQRIISFFDSLVGHFKAGLAYVNVLASGFFAAISGSSPATVAAIGTNLIPEMEKRGYSKSYSTSLTASSGIVGVMIPPSIPFIIYGVSAEVSVGQLFIAGVIPGLLFMAGLMLVALVIYRRTKINANSGSFSMRVVGKTLKSAVWALLAPIIILGGIYGGIFSPTEAAGIAVFYTGFVGLYIYRNLKWKNLLDVVGKSALTSASILPLVIFAATFGRILTLEQVPVTVAAFLTGLTENPIILLLLINVLMILVGMFMETIASIIILTPILLPVVVAVGVDPIHFGVIMAVNLAIGFCTPPLGVNLFVASGISGLPVTKIVRAIVPYLIAMVVLLLIVTFIPETALFLPSLTSGS